MPDTNMTRQAGSSTKAVELDALVIGAGFAGMYQLLCLRDRLGLSVKVMEAGVTKPSAGLLEDRAMVTSLVGARLRKTSKLALPPNSVVTKPAVGVTLMPGCSSSTLMP